MNIDAQFDNLPIKLGLSKSVDTGRAANSGVAGTRQSASFASTLQNAENRKITLQLPTADDTLTTPTGLLIGASADANSVPEEMFTEPLTAEQFTALRNAAHPAENPVATTAPQAPLTPATLIVTAPRSDSVLETAPVGDSELAELLLTDTELASPTIIATPSTAGSHLIADTTAPDITVRATAAQGMATSTNSGSTAVPRAQSLAAPFTRTTANTTPSDSPATVPADTRAMATAAAAPQTPIAASNELLHAASLAATAEAPEPMHGPLNVTATLSDARAAVPTPSLASGVSAELSAPLASQQWRQQLGQQMATMVRRGEQSVALHLNPAELGPMTVNLKMVEQQAQIQLLSAHTLVRTALEQAIPQLREALAEQGISLGETSVGEQRQQHSETRRNAYTPEQSMPADTQALASDAPAATGSETVIHNNNAVNLYV